MSGIIVAVSIGLASRYQMLAGLIAVMPLVGVVWLLVVWIEHGEDVMVGTTSKPPPSKTKTMFMIPNPANILFSSYMVVSGGTELKVFTTNTGDLVKKFYHNDIITGFFFHPNNVLQVKERLAMTQKKTLQSPCLFLLPIFIY